MPIDIEQIETHTVVGFEYDYRLNDKVTCAILGDVPGGIAVQIRMYKGSEKPEEVTQIVVPTAFVDTFIGFLQVSWAKMKADKEKAKKFFSGD